MPTPGDRDDRPTEGAPLRGSATAVVGLAGFVILVAGGAAAFLLFADDGPEPGASLGTSGFGEAIVPDARPRRMHTREEFREMVVGKTRAGVTGVLPGRKFGLEAGPPEVWHYPSLTVNRETGQPDFDAGVVFDGDTATDVRFRGPTFGPRPAAAPIKGID